MPAALDLLIAIAADLAAANFSQPLVVTRTFVAERSLAAMGESIYCDVLPAGERISLASRGLAEREIDVQIVLSRKLSGFPPPDGEADLLLTLADEVARRYNPASARPQGTEFQWRSTSWDNHFDAEELQRLGLFLGRIQWTFAGFLSR